MLERDLSLKETGNDKQWQPRYIEIVGSLYICALLITWVTAGKLFQAGPFVLSASILIYPLSCVFGDILTEVYGFNRTRRLIWMGFVSCLMLLAFTQISIFLPPAADYTQQEAFAEIHGALPRVALASYVAYLLCEFTNSWVMSRMKIRSAARNFPVRAVVSTVAAQFVDSIAFYGIAFLGVVPTEVVVSMIITAWLIKIAYETLVVPFTTLFVVKLKKLEGVEHFDRQPTPIMKF
ncbi:MAG: queuosine precursor transporter [Alphaproteobacteria bacterium]|nr:queuosine precursor transporter [Alphaproteobacteria bacterium]